MNHTTPRSALALAACLAVTVVLAGCRPKTVVPGKNDTPVQKELRKDKNGDD